MNNKQLKNLINQALQMTNQGDYGGALNAARQIQVIASGNQEQLFVAEILVNVGDVKGDGILIQEGIDIFIKNLQAIEENKKHASSLLYNMANGYYALFRLKMMDDAKHMLFRHTELNEAKKYFAKALEHESRDAAQRSRLLVNIGNCYDHLGRVMDALECYDEAQKIDPNNAMALGNKGIAMYNYARLSGLHQGTFLKEAYALLSQVMKMGVSSNAERSFKDYLDSIIKMVPKKEKLEEEFKYPGCKINADSDFEGFLIEFCLENRLYLNVCNFCQKCDAAGGDTAIIQKMIVTIKKNDSNSIEDNSYYRFAAYLNQIKEDFIAARFLLIISQYKKLDLKFVDKRVTIINTLDYSLHNIYLELLKFSFKSFYDILDKIAFFINDYLNLKIPDTKIDFLKIWYSDDRRNVIHGAIEEMGNLSLNALFDIHGDFEKDGQYENLRYTRNALTHRFVKLMMFTEKMDDETMTEDALVERTIMLARIVRNAVIYLLNFVYDEECKKERKSEGNLPTLVADKVPDHLKNI